MREDPLLNDLNLLTRLLFLLVILKKVFSMRNLKICFQLHINSVKVLINNFKSLFPGNEQNFLFFININHVTLGGLSIVILS